MEVSVEIDNQIQKGNLTVISENGDKMDTNTSSQEALESNSSLIKESISPTKQPSSLIEESSSLISLIEESSVFKHKGDGDAPGKEEMDTCSSDNLESVSNLQINCTDKDGVNTIIIKINTGNASTDKPKEKSSDETDAVNDENNDISVAKDEHSEGTNKNTEIPDVSAPTDQTNPRKRKRCRPVKRVRKNKRQIVLQKIEVVKNKQKEDKTEGSKDDVEYNVTVSNLPNSWSYMELKNYIDTECGPVDEMEMIKDDKTGKGAIRLSYQTEAEAKDAIEKLNDKEVAGNKLVLDFSVVSYESDSEAQTESVVSDAIESNNKPWKPDLEPWEVDQSGTYGLKLQYLKSLDITPPLDKWVHVSHFRCDKSELRDVMEMAGNVQMLAVFTDAPRYANVMYSHPLEAVQAVAMLNNQLYYGVQLKVTLDRSPGNTIILPKGLNDIGQGLGIYGKPLRNIVTHYERFKQNNECSLNPLIFEALESKSDSVTSATDKFKVKSINEFSYPIVQPPVVAKPTINLKANRDLIKPSVISSSMAAPKPVHYPKPVTPKPPYIAPRPATPAARPATPAPRPVTPAPRPVTPAPRPVTPAPRPVTPAPRPVTPAPRPATPAPRPATPNFTPTFQQQTYSNFTPQSMNGSLQPQQGQQNLMLQAHPMPQHQQHMMQPYTYRPTPFTPGPTMQPTWGPGMAQPGTGHMPPIPGQTVPGWQAPMGPRPPAPFPNEHVKLLFSNLPLSTKFSVLCEKMSEWGLVVCVQLTTPGCAIVTFANRLQADACSNFYNGRTIENHIVHVQYG